MEQVEFQLEGYEYIEKIGEGTYGKVFKARDLETNKIVALKFMPLIVNLHHFLQIFKNHINNF
jgi:serine/threonine protein kinase